MKQHWEQLLIIPDRDTTAVQVSKGPVEHSPSSARPTEHTLRLLAESENVLFFAIQVIDKIPLKIRESNSRVLRYTQYVLGMI